MPLLMCGPSCSNMCDCCGSCAVACCPESRAGCCTFCNNCCCFGPMCCECCPCGATGCLGYPNHLCGCCGNCNLMWYADCCSICMMADMHAAAYPDPVEAKAQWSSVMCTLLTLGLVSTILQSMWQPEQGSFSQSPESGADTLEWIRYAIHEIGNIIGIVFGVYFAVIFGKAATAIGAASGVKYEPADCCTACCSEEKCCAGCCTSWTCCCTYCCCEYEHFLQVARHMEGSQELQTRMMNARPDSCKCCNCWLQPSLNATSTAESTQAV